MKKTLAWLLTLFMVLTISSVTVFAADPVTVATEAELASALAAGGEVKLGGDIQVNTRIEIPTGVTVTLDLNGKAITVAESTGNHIYAFNNNGNMTIKDSVGTGSVTARGIYNGYDGTSISNTVAGSKLTIESGRFVAMDSNGGAAIFNCAELIINGGVFEGNVALNNRLHGVMDVNKATVIGVDDYAIQNNGGTMVLDDVTYTGGFGGVAQYESTSVLTINGGTYSPNGREGTTCHVLYLSAGEATINGGVFTHSVNGVDGGALTVGDMKKLTVTGGTFNNGASQFNSAQIWYDTEVSISGGTFTGNLILDSDNMTVTGGTYNVSDANATKLGTMMPTGATITVSGKQMNKTETGLETVIVAKIGETGYATLTEAIDALVDGDTLTIFEGTYDAALTINKSNVTVIGQGNVVLNGIPSLRGTNYRVENIDFNYSNGENNLSGSGLIKDCTFTATENTFRYCYGATNGAITFEGTTFNPASGKWAVHFDSASGTDLTFTNCVVNGRVALGSDLGSLTATGTEFNKAYVNVWGTEDGATFENCEFNDVPYVFTGYDSDNEVAFTDCTVVKDGNSANVADIIYGGADNADAKIYDNGALVGGAEAQIGDVKYPTLQAAIDAAVAGDTIVVLKDVTVTTPAHGQNALNYAKAVDCVIDLNGKTLTADTGNSVFRFNISGTSATSNVTVTLKNGKVVADPNTWCAVMATGLSADAKAIFNLENLTIENSKPGDLAVKAWSNSVINATNVVVNSTKGAGCFYAVGGEMVLTNCTATQEGLHTAPYNSMAFAVSNNGKLTVNSGNYSSTPTAAAEGNNQGTSHGSWVGGVMNSGGTLIINDGTFANGNFDDDSLATAARGLLFVDTYASLEVNGGTFNALKSIIDYQNNLGIAAGNPVVTLKGGTYSADPSHATYKFIADDHRVNANTDGTFTVAIIPYVAQVGSVKYESLADAIAAAVDGDTVLLIDDITTDSAVAISKKITLDLNGKTITGMDNATGSFGLININPGAELTITGNGKITLTAANNRAWNAYSSVISNQRGKLIVENGTIEHLGGTDMAYGIDNLTNGKGTYAETVINGGTIKSTYRAIRQFLNGVEAQNILTINAGTVYGENTGVFFHDPSANANSGTLTIAEGAQVNGVYLFVTAGSTEWPVEVSIAGSAIGAQGVTSKNVPDGYALDFVEGNYGVYNGVARIGTTCYETLEAAIAAAVDGDTIELLMGVEITKTLDVSYNSDFDKINVVINGNGHTVKAVASDYWTANPKAWLAEIAWNVTLNDIVFDGNNLGMRGLQFYTSESVLNNVTVKNISNDSWGITDYAIHSNASELTVTGALTFENCKHGHLAVSVGSNLPADTVSNVTVADSAVVSGVTVVLGGDNTTVVTKNPAMVSGAVTNLNNVYYSTLEDAFAAAANNSTITLIADVNAAVTYAVNKTLTLDLSGYTITSDAAATLTATAGKLTIVDSSADKSGAIIGAKAIHSSAYVAIQSGKFVGAITTANGQADDSQVCITGGNFSVEPNANIIKHTYIAVLAEDGTYNVIPDEYEVIIIANGGEVSGAGFYKFGETVYLFAGNYPGYQFAGWMSDDVELTDRGNTLISFAMPDHAVTVTAYWATSGVSTPVVPVVTGTLHFETNGGTAIDSLTGVSGRRVDLTQYVPALEGYTFAGWYSDAALTKPVTEITLRGTKTVYAGWIKNVTPDVPVVTMPFTDVAADAYYYNAVLWAVNTGITNGITDTTFAPDMVCTRAQVVTFLWRAAGCPVATYNDMPFVDVSRDMYYYDAVLWAVEMGITNGISDTEFAPDAECSRAQIVTFLWRALGAPDAAADAGFVDVDADAYYATAVEWAVDNGITNGMGDNTFGADADCTRGQTVTFLFRFFCK